MPSKNVAQANRFEDIDAFRAVLMMLSLVLHAATVYATSRPHITGNSDRSGFFTWLINGLHLTITPPFFVISAFFVALMLSRTSWHIVLAERTRRLLLPTLSIALTFNIGELYLRYRDLGGTLSFAPFLQSDNFQSLWLSGRWQLHLWFLVDLMSFVLMTLLVVALLPKVASWLAQQSRTGGAALARLASHDAGLLLLLAGFAAISVTLCGLMAQLPFAYDLILPGFTSLYGLATYLPYFIFGLLLYASAELRNALLRFRLWMPMLMALGFILQPFPTADINFWFQGPLSHDRQLQTLMLLAQYFVCWSIIIGGLQLFHRFCNVGTACRRTWVSRAQSMYLFHHGLVYAGGVLLVQVHMPPLLEFALLVSTVTLLVVLIHDKLVARFALLGLLFNGRGRVRIPRSIDDLMSSLQVRAIAAAR